MLRNTIKPPSSLHNHSISKDSILKLAKEDFKLAGKTVEDFVRNQGERGFETIIKEGSIIFLLKNEQQSIKVQKILEPTGLKVRPDKLLKGTLTVDIKEITLDVDKLNSPVTNYSSFE